MAWIATVVVLGLFACAKAPPAAGPEQAQALVAQAVALYRSAGPESAIAAMNDPEGGFRQLPLYIFVIDPGNVTVAHAADPSRVGNDANLTMDADGRPIGPLLREAATPEGAWVQYRFTNYANGRVEDKTSWVVLEDGYIFGSGYYGSGQ
jgi:signal transduction histidine kinase